MAEADANLFSVSTQERAGVRGARLLMAAAATLVFFFALYSLQARDAYVMLLAGGVAALLAARYAYTYVAAHRDWLVCAILLIFLINAVFFLNPAARAVFHYGALALFCLPVAIPALRSDVFRSSGFKLYTVYFIWAAVTVVYSLAPDYSLARLGEAFLLLAALAAIAADAHGADDSIRLLARFLAGGGLMLMVIAFGAVILPHGFTWVSPAQSYTLEELRSMQKQGISVAGVDRFRGLFNGPNDIGALMLILVGPAIVCWRTAARRERVLLAGLIAVAVLMAAMADSRSPFLALGVGGVLYTVWRWRTRGVLLLGAAAAAAGGALLLYTHGNLSAYIGRGNVGTLTGRTDIWSFVVSKIRERPILGYGYEVSGAIFLSRYFPIWWGPWDLGPHSSLHNGYFDHAVGVGIPATLVWLYIILRPWVFVLRQPGDPWRLKSIFLLVVIPILINNLTEALLGDFANSVAILFGLAWALGERYRQLALRRAEAERTEAFAKLPRASMALAGIGGAYAIPGSARGSKI